MPATHAQDTCTRNITVSGTRTTGRPITLHGLCHVPAEQLSAVLCSIVCKKFVPEKNLYKIDWHSWKFLVQDDKFLLRVSGACAAGIRHSFTVTLLWDTPVRYVTSSINIPVRYVNWRGNIPVRYVNWLGFCLAGDRYLVLFCRLIDSVSLSVVKIFCDLFLIFLKLFHILLLYVLSVCRCRQAIIIIIINEQINVVFRWEIVACFIIFYWR